MVKSATFVLVHGAWHGGWCYRRVADRLRAQGHHVFTPTLTGLGERSHLFSGAVNLTTHIDDVVNVIHWERLERVVLLGHSYGGMVIAGVADRVPDKIASIVYLDAFVPEDGQSLYDLAPPEIVNLQREGASAHGGLAIPATPSAGFAVNEADRAWVDALCTPQPLGCMNERLAFKNGGGAVRDKVYVLAAGWAPGRGFRRFYDKVKDEPSWTAHQIDCGHDVMVDQPEALAAILEQTAARIA